MMPKGMVQEEMEDMVQKWLQEQFPNSNAELIRGLRFNVHGLANDCLLKSPLRRRSLHSSPDPSVSLAADKSTQQRFYVNGKYIYANTITAATTTATTLNNSNKRPASLVEQQEPQQPQQPKRQRKSSVEQPPPFFSSDQERQLIDLILQYGTQWTRIAAAMGSSFSPTDCARRWSMPHLSRQLAPAIPALNWTRSELQLIQDTLAHSTNHDNSDSVFDEVASLVSALSHHQRTAHHVKSIYHTIQNLDLNQLLKQVTTDTYSLSDYGEQVIHLRTSSTEHVPIRRPSMDFYESTIAHNAQPPASATLHHPQSKLKPLSDKRRRPEDVPETHSILVSTGALPSAVPPIQTSTAQQQLPIQHQPILVSSSTPLPSNPSSPENPSHDDAMVEIKATVLPGASHLETIIRVITPYTPSTSTTPTSAHYASENAGFIAAAHHLHQVLHHRHIPLFYTHHWTVHEDWCLVWAVRANMHQLGYVDARRTLRGVDRGLCQRVQWDVVSRSVPGKTGVECRRRFMEDFVSLRTGGSGVATGMGAGGEPHWSPAERYALLTGVLRHGFGSTPLPTTSTAAGAADRNDASSSQRPTSLPPIPSTTTAPPSSSSSSSSSSSVAKQEACWQLIEVWMRFMQSGFGFHVRFYRSI